VIRRRRRAVFPQPDFNSFGQFFSGHEQAVALGVVGDAVQDVGLPLDDIRRLEKPG